VVVESAALYAWWREGRYRPYDEETLIDLLIDFKAQVPPYVRIERVSRDIAAPLVRAGSRRNNLRQEILIRMKAQGLACRCIRCREVQFRPEGEFALTRRDFEAADGREIFLSFEDPATDRLAALLRLRIPGQFSPVSPVLPVFPALRGAALVRELHTYGRQLPLGDGSTWHLSPLKGPGPFLEAAQHRGFGRRLMAEAERIAAQEFGLSRMAVISGIGVREYYRRIGYTLDGTYMVKELPRGVANEWGNPPIHCAG
jgi:elongator complex protein 3